VWQAALDGRAMRFRLAGINNQNFLMLDEETGSWWQQISGVAIAGPLRGRQLTRIFHDEVAFRIWGAEHPDTRVLVPANDSAWIAFSTNWEEETARYPVPTRVRLTDSLPPRTVVATVERNGDARAWTLEALERQKVIIDRVGGTPVAVVLGDDNKSVRAFQATVDGKFLELFAEPGSVPLRLRDGGTGSVWDFRGRALEGPLAGKQLQPLGVLKDYWFNWKNYHPEGRLYNLGPQ
jgi:hypothetical protein